MLYMLIKKDLQSLLKNANKNSEEENKATDKELISSGNTGKFVDMRDNGFVMVGSHSGYVDVTHKKSIVKSIKELFDIYDEKVEYSVYSGNTIVITKILEDSTPVYDDNDGTIQEIRDNGYVLISNLKAVNGTYGFVQGIIDYDKSIVKNYYELKELFDHEIKYNKNDDNTISIIEVLDMDDKELAKVLKHANNNSSAKIVSSGNIGTFQLMQENGYVMISGSNSGTKGYINFTHEKSIVKTYNELSKCYSETIEYSICDDERIVITKIISNNDSEYGEDVFKFHDIRDNGYIGASSASEQYNKNYNGYIDYNKSIVKNFDQLSAIYDYPVELRKESDGKISVVRVLGISENDLQIILNGTNDNKTTKKLSSSDNVGYIKDLKKDGKITLITNKKEVNGVVDYNVEGSVVNGYDDLMNFYEQDLVYSIYDDNTIGIMSIKGDEKNTRYGVVDRIGIDGQGVVIKDDKGGLVGTGVDYEKSIVKNVDELKGLIGKRVKYIWAEADKLTIVRILDLSN